LQSTEQLLEIHVIFLTEIQQ